MFGIKIEEKRPILCFQALQDEGGEWEQKKKRSREAGKLTQVAYSHPGKPPKVSAKSTKLMHANASDCVVTVT